MSAGRKSGRREVRVAQIAQSELGCVPDLVAEMAVAFHAQHVEIYVSRAWQHIPKTIIVI